MSRRVCATMAFWGLLAASSTHAATLALAPHASDAVRSAATEFGAQLDDSVWKFRCGGDDKTEMSWTLYFNLNGKVAVTGGDQSTSWEVTSSRQVRLTEASGENFQLVFDEAVEKFEYINFKFERCVGQKLPK